MQHEIAKQILKISDNFQPEIGVILGSGWSEVVNMLQDAKFISYSSLNHMPKTTVKGHEGNIVLGTIAGKKVAFVQGRFHIYEGYDLQKVCLPVSILNALGATKLIITNSAGGINPNYNVGDLVIIDDQINLTGKNPLIGLKATEEHPIFVDMTYAYDRDFISEIKNVLTKNNLKPKTGTYLQLTGPTYETPAEIKMAKNIGADLVGMSTAVEVIVANYLKMRVAGLSCVTNMAAGIVPEKLSHKDVLKTINENKSTLANVLKEIIENI